MDPIPDMKTSKVIRVLLFKKKHGTKAVRHASEGKHIQYSLLSKGLFKTMLLRRVREGRSAFTEIHDSVS